MSLPPDVSRARVPDRGRSRPGCAPRVPGGSQSFGPVRAERPGRDGFSSARVCFSSFDTESFGEPFALPCTACLILFSVYSRCFKLESKTRRASVLKRGSFKQGVMLQLYQLQQRCIKQSCVISDLLFWAGITFCT